MHSTAEWRTPGCKKKDATPMKRTVQNSLSRRHNEVKISKVFHQRAYQVDYL